MRTRDSNERTKAGFREKPETGDWRGEGEKREEPRVVELNGAGVRVPKKNGMRSHLPGWEAWSEGAT